MQSFPRNSNASAPMIPYSVITKRDINEIISVSATHLDGLNAF